MRDVQPVRGFDGVRASSRRWPRRRRPARGRCEVLVVISGTPSGLAAPAVGLRAGAAPSRARARRAPTAAMAVYGKLITRLFDLAARDRASSSATGRPWNEPNHPYFISPAARRAAGPARRRRRSSRTSSWLASVMQASSTNEPGEQELVLGELAGLLRPQAGLHARCQEFIAALPRDLVCGAPIFSQHGYVGGPDPVDEVADALAKHGCARRPRDLDHRDRRRTPAPRRAAQTAAARRCATPAARSTRACVAGTRTRASPPRSSTRCARTTASRPAWSPPTSPRRTRPCASGRPGAAIASRTPRRPRRAAASGCGSSCGPCATCCRHGR